jgi:ABC-type multidrug transport system fused ATPase/permease subunit
MWFFYLFYQIQGVVFNVFGVPIGQVTAAYRQGMGAYLVMTVYIFWLGKEHLGDIFRKVPLCGIPLRGTFSAESDVDDENEPLPYRWAVLGLIFGLLVAIIMCNAAGISLWVSICILLAFFSIVTVLSWLISSAGLIFAEQMFLPSEYVETIAGSSAIKPSGLTMLAFQGAITHDMLAVMMPNFMNSFKISDYGKLNRRSLTVAIAIAVLAGLLVSYYSYFKVTYHYGGLNLEYYCYISASQEFFRRAASAMQYPTGANFKELLFMLSGATFMGFLLFMRYRFIWWPLHPAGYLMHLTWIAGVIWFSFFVGWILKYVILKFGGVGEYRRLRPIFLGAVVGESIIGVIWVIINMFARVGYSILPL